MKKAISIILTLALVISMAFIPSEVQISAETFNIVSAPADGSTVDLLNGDDLEFALHYNKSSIDKYYSRYSNKYYPAPYTISWNEVPGAENYNVIIGTNKDLSGAKGYTVKGTTLEIEDLLMGTDYYYKVETTVGGQEYSTGVIATKTSLIPRTIRVDSIGNTRDFGGCFTIDKKYRVKQGIIYRGANVDKISSAGKDKLVKTYGIKTDLDLRGRSKVSPLGSKIKCISLSAPMYRSGLIFEDNWPTLRDEVMTFANPSNFPVYIHCAIGRDRTGTLCVLLGALAGMSESDIARDYQFSFFANISNSDVTDPVKYTTNNFDALMTYLKYYDKGTLQENTMEYMRECLGITQADLNKIRSNILTPAPKYIPAPTVPTPAKVKLKSAKNVKKKSILVKFKKAKDAKGYQICWARSKKFKKAKTKFTTKLKYKIKKLKKKKTYYVRVRAYNINGHTKVFGKYSKKKKVKIKK